MLPRRHSRLLDFVGEFGGKGDCGGEGAIVNALHGHTGEQYFRLRPLPGKTVPGWCLGELPGVVSITSQNPSGGA